MSSSVLNDYIAGAIGGAAGLIVGHPFDTTKVQLQTQQTSSPYKNTWDAIRNIGHHGMAKGFFRGMGFPLVSYGVINSLFFGVYGHTLKHLTGDNKKANYGAIFISGCMGGFVQLSVACPVDVVKVILQSQISKPGADQRGTLLQSKSKYFRGPSQLIYHLYKTKGVRSLYSGMVAMGIRDIPGYALYILFYEWLFNNITRLEIGDKHGAFASIVAGGWAGALSWAIMSPFDVVKSLMQADVSQKKYRGFMHCVQLTYHSHGIKAFYAGCVINCVRGFPVNGITFLIYSQLLRKLNTKVAQPEKASRVFEDS